MTQNLRVARVPWVKKGPGPWDDVVNLNVRWLQVLFAGHAMDPLLGHAAVRIPHKDREHPPFVPEQELLFLNGGYHEIILLRTMPPTMYTNRYTYPIKSMFIAHASPMKTPNEATTLTHETTMAHRSAHTVSLLFLLAGVRNMKPLSVVTKHSNR